MDNRTCMGFFMDSYTRYEERTILKKEFVYVAGKMCNLQQGSGNGVLPE